MIVSYSALNRFESPKLTLCNPGSVCTDGLLSKVVGILTDESDMEIVFNFNATSELNFRITKVQRDDADANEHTFALFKAVQNRRLIFVDGIGYFMITGVEDGCEGKLQYKDVKAQSIDVEIQQKMIPYIADGTYRFASNNDTNTKGLLETIVETLPLWTIAYVDPAIEGRYRTFEDVDTSLNCLAFMMNNMQEAFECIFIFDPISREISVYDQANYVRQTNIHITKDDIINSINITENADDLYTAINVLGNENVTISAINPLGTNTIYDFNFYLDWMSDELKAKVIAWQSLVDARMQPYYNINLEYYNALEDASDDQRELERLAQQLLMYQRCRDNVVAESNTSRVASYNDVIVANGGTPVNISEDIAQTIASLDGLIAECQTAYDNQLRGTEGNTSYIAALRDQINAIHDEVALTSYFTTDELGELSHYIFEGSYTDEYVTITDIMSYSEKFNQMKVLYDRAKSRLARVSQPTREFDIDAENFIFVKEFSHWSEQLETGCLINVELEPDDIALLFLSNITVNYEDNSLSLTFGNRFNKFDPKTLFDDVLGDVSRSANTLGYLKEILYPIKSGEFNSMKEAIQTSRNLTMSGAIASDNQEVLIDSTGYTGRKLLGNGVYDPRQVKITGKMIVFTDDAWDTCKVAIGELVFGNGESVYGVNAQAIVGDMIMGNNLRILDNNGNDLLSVVNGEITTHIDNIINGDSSGLQPDGTDSVIKQITELRQTAQSLEIVVSEISVPNENGTHSAKVDSITTKTGYTFGADGLNIHRSGEEMYNILDNHGMRVKRNDDDILVADNNGVDAINLLARQFLIMGLHSRFEDYSNGTDSKRTACFFVG